MKNFLIAVLLSTLLFSPDTEAQTSSRYDGKGLVSIKTDPVLKYDPDSPSIAAVLELVTRLEARGASIKLFEQEVNGTSWLNIKVDGTVLPPVMLNCKTCEPIVFEY